MAAQQAMRAQLTETQREQMTRFQGKATGWLTVAAGAGLTESGIAGDCARSTRPFGREI